MASDRRTEANRRNAKKSTGPATAGGKSRVSQNAMKHGLAAAKHFVLTEEDPARFVELEEALFDELDPRTSLEAEYVKRIVTLLWRLRRIPEFEAALLTFHEFRLRNQQYELSVVLHQHIAPEAGEEARRVAIGEVVNELFRLGHADKLSRYESSLRAQLTKSLQELKSLQLARISASSERGADPDGVPKGHLLPDNSENTE